MNDNLLLDLNKNIEKLIESINYANKMAFSVREAAKYLNIGETSLRKYIKNGDIEFRKNGSDYIF